MGNYFSKNDCNCLFKSEMRKKTVEIDKLEDKIINENKDMTGDMDRNSIIDSHSKNDNSLLNLKKFVKLQRNIDSIIIEDKEISHNNIVIQDTQKSLNEEDRLQTEKSKTNKEITNTSRNSLFSWKYSESVESSVNCGESSQSVKGYFILNNSEPKYFGQIVNNKKEGIGKVIWTNGSKFLGTFLNNRVNGIGVYNDSKGSTFVGEYVNNKPQGWAVFTLNDGTRHEGMWKGRRQEGIGLEVWPDWTVYQGEYLFGKKCGIGLYKWPDGTIYEGEWNDNAICGYGILYFKDDRVYMGQFLKGLMHGYGEFYWPDGKKYIGYYQMDKKEGFGIFLWNLYPLKYYVGMWGDGEQNGVGYIMQDKSIKYGLWNKGRKEISFKGLWEMKKYARDHNLVYSHHLERNPKEILKLD